MNGNTTATNQQHASNQHELSTVDQQRGRKHMKRDWLPLLHRCRLDDFDWHWNLHVVPILPHFDSLLRLVKNQQSTPRKVGRAILKHFNLGACISVVEKNGTIESRFPVRAQSVPFCKRFYQHSGASAAPREEERVLE